MLLLMISLAIKANVYALIYMLLIYKFVATKSKTQLLARFNLYMSALFFIQYLLYTLNLTAGTSPSEYPSGFPNYPKMKDGSVQYWGIPWFFQYKEFQDLRIAYILGIGVDRDQVRTLYIDCINLFIVTMYLMTFRNPILAKRMVKVFWLFPTP